MEFNDIAVYLLQCLNMALGNSIQGETSYTNSFEILVKEDGVFFIPRLPAAYVIDSDLYEKIYMIISVALYPNFTLLKQTSIYLVPVETDDYHIQRALFFPWKKGISSRLVISDIEEFSANMVNERIPIMQNLNIEYNRVTSIAIAGSTGSGKSYMLTYLLNMLKGISDLVIVDPKFDSPSRWAKYHQIPVIYPSSSRAKSDFVSEVNASLSECLKTIHSRQSELFKDPTIKFRHLTIVIDEVLALSEGVNKNIKEAFFSLLSQISLLGRATRVHLLLVSQRFDHNAIPVSVREQVSVVIQVGNINNRSAQFLFPDLNVEGIVIPTGKGTGLIRVIDSEEPYQVLPLLCPTFYTKGDYHA